MKNRKLLYLLVSVFLLLTVGLKAQEKWVVPDDQKGKLSKSAFDEMTRTAGENLYMINCKSCHGNPGQSNYINLVPIPGDPAKGKMQNNLDGQLYYKIRTGRGPMPSFKNVLSPNQVWQLISYLRSFNDTYIQEIAEKVEGMALKWEDIEILLSILDESGSIQAIVKGMEETGPSPIPEAEIQLFAKRTFGNLLLGEGVTNEKGIAVFKHPKDLPGDPEGKIELLAKLYDEEKFGTIIKDTAITVGMPLIPVSLVENRAMWNISKKAPYWILITYFGGVLLIWGIIFFVVIELRSIFKIGQYFEKEHNKSIDQ